MCNKIVFSIVFLAQLCFGVANSDDMAIPEAIKAPGGNSAYLTVHAKGDQIFHCVLKAGEYSWKWHAPEAKLYDTHNQALVGSHGVGPSWTHHDGSSIKAKAIQKVDAPDKSSASWLLLEVTGHQRDGVLAKASYIQRINTQGGGMPSSGCDANHLGSEKRVRYSADYVFYSK
jgi:Protein of unknown function (DUF3455)